MSKVTPETAFSFPAGGDGKQLSELSRDSLVRMVEEQAQQEPTPLGRRMRSSPNRKKGGEMAKRSKHIQHPSHDVSQTKEDSLEQFYQHHTPKTVFVPHQKHHRRKQQPDQQMIPVIITSHTPSSYHHHHHQGNIIPPSQRVDTGMDELLSAKSGGTDSTSYASSAAGAAPTLISCPPPVSYHRRVPLNNGMASNHHRTSYRSLTSNASSTALELECLVSVATPPGLLRNTTSSSARWDYTAGAGAGGGHHPPRPSNPVPMQVDAVTRQESGASGITLHSATAPPSWNETSSSSSQTGLAPYQPYRHM